MVAIFLRQHDVEVFGPVQLRLKDGNLREEGFHGVDSSIPFVIVRLGSTYSAARPFGR
jgi:hypothetical protein